MLMCAHISALKKIWKGDKVKPWAVAELNFIHREIYIFFLLNFLILNINTALLSFIIRVALKILNGGKNKAKKNVKTSLNQDLNVKCLYGMIFL